MMRSALRKFLEDEQFTVCGEVEDGLIGIEKAKELSPDLVFLDFSTPGMNGAEAASILKRAVPNVPIILFTNARPLCCKDSRRKPFCRSSSSQAL